jgi:hypothetical protein
MALKKILLSPEAKMALKKIYPFHLMRRGHKKKYTPFASCEKVFLKKMPLSHHVKRVLKKNTPFTPCENPFF